MMNWNQLLSIRRIRELAGGHTPKPHNDETRSEIHRDYGRAVFSTPVRRLQDKAQVFPLEKIDAVRTRLTHSLEVSAVARGLANGVAQELVKKGEINQADAYDIETVAATCGLLHDIGNPPFGHFGESAIRDWFTRKGEENQLFWSFDTTIGQRLKADLLSFEGNAQTLRLLSKLQVLSDRHGLNLTAATFSALGKYTANSLEIDKSKKPKKKLGYFTTEEKVVQLVRSETGTGDARNPIALLVEASDDMAYSIIDIEDGIKKGALSWDEVHRMLVKNGSALGAKLAKEAQDAMGRSSLIDHLNAGAKQEGTAQYFRTFLIRDASAAVRRKFSEHYNEIMDGSYSEEILYDSDVGPIYEVLKQVGGQRVYNAKEILRLELLGHRVIHSLMDIFWQAEKSDETKSYGEKAYALMSQNYRVIYQTETDGEVPSEYRKALLVTDYICGMTDSFALNLHQELTNG